MMSLLSKLALLFLAPTFAHALVGLSWNVVGDPPSGLTNIAFPINMENATHVSGYYYAMQFGFGGLSPGPSGVSNIGYTGLQPRPDSNGQSTVHGVFSSFVPGTVTNDTNCHEGADGGPGVSCAVEIPSSYNHTYSMQVQNTSDTTWTGTMVDTVTGVKTHVGSWTLPDGALGILDYQAGFVEYYPWNDDEYHPCDTLPWTEVFFGTPTTTASGIVASLGTPFENGDCIGEVDFQETETSDGYIISVGFRNASGAALSFSESPTASSSATAFYSGSAATYSGVTSSLNAAATPS